MFCYPSLNLSVFYTKYRNQGRRLNYAETKFIFKRRITGKGTECQRFCTAFEDEADRKEAQKLSSALLSTAKKLSVEPSKLMERLRTAQH